MKRLKLFTAICLTAGLLLAGCTQDELNIDHSIISLAGGTTTTDSGEDEMENPLV